VNAGRPSRAVLDKAIGHHQAGQLAEAERLYRQILARDPKDFDALHLLGVVRHQQGRGAEAVELVGAAVQQNPDSARALSNYGLILSELGRFDEALTALDRAVAVNPGFADAHNNRSSVLQRLGRNEDALASVERALALQQDHVEAHNNRGNALQGMRRHTDALTCYDRALALRPDYSEAHYNRGSALRQLKRPTEALAAYDRALALRPGHAEALFSRGDTLCELARQGEAIANYEQAIALRPDHPHALNGIADAALSICDWKRTQDLTQRLLEGSAAGATVINPFTLIRLTDDPGLHRRAAEAFLRDRIRAARPPLHDSGTWRHDKIRVAYLSADYHNHATAYLIAELIELHDRSRFETIAASYGPADGSDVRKRLTGAFDRFLDVSAKSDREIAALLAALKVDIAVDLKGYTRDSRPDILSHRPAPIQVSWLGYPGTLGADFIDYIIADETVAPPAHAPFYAERIVQLSGCYQANDRKRAIAERTYSRAEAGLPEDGFVFCCFNNSFKFTPQVFDAWMRLLKGIPGSVLWLLRDNAAAEDNLRREAATRGVDAARLVFAERMPLADHLARHRLADLFLDTLPYNAHTTASDALWAGLPLVTCQGNAFAGRVAASLLNAAGLPELVTHNLTDYEALARRLATDTPMLGAARDKLAQNRLSCPLFDTDRFRRHLESAYDTMWNTWQRGEPAAAFRVNAMAP
jgi:predicted O-linked N-acetylglucosamine transferase (SPINDLY family)